jgi:hypothetical protein
MAARARRFGWVAWLAVTGLGLVLACLPDLPGATLCPPSATSESCVGAAVGPGGALGNGPGGNGPPSLGGAGPGGGPVGAGQVGGVAGACLSSAVLGCVSRQRGGCSCDRARECPSDTRACWPSGDCPPQVRNTVADARCFGAPYENVSPGLGPAECQCGCAGCAAVCDSIGPVLGAAASLASTDGGLASTPGSLAVSLAGLGLPANGRLGVYVRARGHGSLSFQFPPGATAVAPGPAQIDGDQGFVEVVALPSGLPASGASSPLPDELEVGALAPNGIEVDCVIPLVVP